MRYSARVARPQRNVSPFVNVSENEGSYTVELAVPGFGKEDVSITFEKDTLVIKGAVETNDKKYTRREFTVQNFEKRYQLSDDLDTDNIQAELVNGVLTINLVPKPEVAPKTISVA